MKVVRDLHGEEWFDLEDPEFDFQTSEALVKVKFRMLDHWFEVAARLEKENKELKLQLEIIHKRSAAS